MDIGSCAEWVNAIFTLLGILCAFGVYNQGKSTIRSQIEALDHEKVKAEQLRKLQVLDQINNLLDGISLIGHPKDGKIFLACWLLDTINSDDELFLLGFHLIVKQTITKDNRSILKGYIINQREGRGPENLKIPESIMKREEDILEYPA